MKKSKEKALKMATKLLIATKGKEGLPTMLRELVERIEEIKTEKS